MFDALLATKLYPPQVRSDSVIRMRLLDRLLLGIQRKLSLVVAPAGFGKTTLLVEWLARLTVKSAWFSIEAADNSSTRFLAYLIAALQTIQAELGERALALLYAPQQAPTELILTTLINELNAAPERIVLILDDYHEITDPAVHQALGFLIDHQPAGLHLVLISRADPPLPLARMRARGDMIELRAADLRFTPVEAVDLLNRVMGLPLSAEEIAVLDTRTEGWIAGLQLAALALQNQPDPARFIESFAGTHQYIFDYLVEEILQYQPPEVQAFLLETAFLDQLHTGLCNAVTQRSDSAEILHRLHQANLFITALDPAREWFRYHPLFQDVLQMRAQSAIPERLAELHCRAGAWLANANRIEEALAHWLAAGETVRAAEVIEQHAWPRFEAGDIFTVRAWVNQLPPDMLSTRPWLILVQATILLSTGRLDALIHLLDETAGLVEAHGNSSTFQGELAHIRATLARFQQNTAQCIAFAQQALALLPKERRGTRAGALANLVMAHMERNEMEAMETALKTLVYLGEMGYQSAVLGAMQGAAWMNIRQGHLHQGFQRYSDGLAQASGIRPRPFVLLGLAHSGLGEVLYEWDDLPGAEAHLRQGLDDLSGSIEQLIVAFAAGKLSQTLAAAGRFPAAQAVLDDTDAWFRQMKLADLGFVAMLAGYRALLALRQGSLLAASRWAESNGLASHEPFSFPRLVEALILVRVYLAQNRPDTALGVLLLLTEEVTARNWHGFQIEIDCLAALAHQATGQREQALDYLSEALILAAPEGYLRVFLDEGAVMETLLRATQSRGLGAAYPALILAKFAVKAAPDLPEPLSEREVEVLKLAALGLSNQKIAAALVIALPTVKKHISNILVKLDVANRTQAIARARELGLFS